MNTALSVVVPHSIQFLNWGWWIIHVIGIAAVFLIGVAVSRKCMTAKPPVQ